MTDAEILKKAIRKAVENGWNSGLLWNVRSGERGSYYTTTGRIYSEAIETMKRMNDKEAYLDPMIDGYVPEEIIFSHNFAKAFFGEEWGKKYKEDRTLWHPSEPPWKFYIVLLVLKPEDERIKYLEEFVTAESQEEKHGYKK